VNMEKKMCGRKQKDSPPIDAVKHSPVSAYPVKFVDKLIPRLKVFGWIDMHLWRKDGISIVFLIFLYVLQGVPLGLSAAIPLILTNQGITYAQQALFSFTFWPFSLKLLWAPIVDGFYSVKFGRRKSWLVPIQYFIGGMMLWLSYQVEILIVSGEVLILTIIFFLLNFGAATQDIAVDGWCLTMLSKENVGWASTCNSVGQTAGYFLGNMVFLALESVDFSNQWVRPLFGLEKADHGVVTLPKFLWAWGIIFILATSLVALLKNDKKLPNEEFGVLKTYKLLGTIIKKKPVLKYIAILMTCKVAFSVTDGVTALKFVEKGFPKENLALVGTMLMPINILLPLFLSKWTAGPRPMSLWIRAYAPRLIYGYICCYAVYLASIVGEENSERTSGLDYPTWFYISLVLFLMVHQVLVQAHFVSSMAFHAKVSDPVIGGTYMTLLNTVANLGGQWCNTAVLYFVDSLSRFECRKGTNIETVSKSLQHECEAGGGSFVTSYDGYYIEAIVCTTFGFLWLLYTKRHVLYVDSLPTDDWLIKSKRYSALRTEEV